jgi:hypothetical protein
VNNQSAPLVECGVEMMSYHGVLDDHRFSVSDAYIRVLYSAFGWPAKLARQVRAANPIYIHYTYIIL